MIRFSLSALVLGLTLSAATARAEEAPSPAASVPEAAKQEAARRFGSAIKLYEDGDYQLALAEFERVYELVPDYRVLYNIGQVSMQLGRYARALRTLREYVGRGGDAIPSDRRSGVRADIELLEARTGALTLDIQPAGAEVWVDGVLVGQAPLAQPIVVDVGERTVQVRLTGYLGRTQSITLAGGDRREVALKLEPEPTSARSPTPPEARSDPSPVKSRRAPATQQKPRTLLWVGWGTTATLAVGSAVAAALGASSAGSLKDLRESRTATRDSLDDAHGQARARFLVADILGVAAAATGATTLYFQLSSSGQGERAPEQARLGLSLLPSGVSLRVEH